MNDIEIKPKGVMAGRPQCHTQGNSVNPSLNLSPFLAV